MILRGVTSFSNPGTGSHLASTTAPAVGSFSACGFATLEADRNDYSMLFSIDDGSSNWTQMGTDTDGTSIVAFTSAGGGVSTSALANMSLGSPFFWGITGAGAGANNLIAYWRQVSRGHRIVSASTTGVATFGSATLKLAGDGFGGAYSWQGRMWGTRVWGRVLTPAQMHAESFRGDPQNISGLWAWYPLEGNVNRLGEDWSGNRRHLTRTGTGAPSRIFVPISYWEKQRRSVGKAPAAGGGPAAAALARGTNSVIQAGVR